MKRGKGVWYGINSSVSHLGLVQVGASCPYPEAHAAADDADDDDDRRLGPGERKRCRRFSFRIIQIQLL